MDSNVSHTHTHGDVLWLWSAPYLGTPPQYDPRPCIENEGLGDALALDQETYRFLLQAWIARCRSDTIPSWCITNSIEPNIRIPTTSTYRDYPHGNIALSAVPSGNHHEAARCERVSR